MVKITIHRHHCKIECEEEIQKQLYNILSYEIPNKRYDPRVRLRKWDGVVRLFNRNTNVFQIGLLYKVLDWLEFKNIRVDVIDKRKDVSINIDTSFFDKPLYDKKTLRYYQKDTLHKFKNFVEKYKLYRGVFALPPRSGKTFVSGVLNKSTGLYPTIFIVHKIDLARQAKSEFEKLFNMKIGLVGDGYFDIDSDIVVSTIQSIANTFDIEEEFDEVEKDFNKHEEFKEFLASCQFCIIDECHVSGSEIWKQLPKALNSLEMLIGLSGTPYREDNADLLIEQLCGPVVYTVERAKLVEEGFLLPVRVYFIHLPAINVSGYSWQTQKSEAITHNKYIKLACEKLIDRFEKKDLSSVIMLREKVQANFINKDYKLPFLNGNTAGIDREKTYKKLNQKDILSIVSNITDIGVDIPSLDNCIICDLNKSKNSVLQRARCTTPDGIKKYGNIIVLVPQINLPHDWKKQKIKNYIEKHYKKILSIYSSEETFTIKHLDYDEI